MNPSNRVAGTLQCQAEDGADAACPNNADTQPVGLSDRFGGQGSSTLMSTFLRVRRVEHNREPRGHLAAGWLLWWADLIFWRSIRL